MIKNFIIAILLICLSFWVYITILNHYIDIDNKSKANAKIRFSTDNKEDPIMNESDYKLITNTERVTDSKSNEQLIKVSYSNKEGKSIIKYYNKQGSYHRIEGPAINYPNGGYKYYKNGKLHNLDEAAVVLYDSNYRVTTEWWINGCKLTEIEFDMITFGDEERKKQLKQKYGIDY